MDNVNYAAEYAANSEELAWWVSQGFAALPLCPHDHAGISDRHCEYCASPGKSPLIRWADLDAARAAVELERWAHSFPRHNVGMRLGEVNHLVGLDIDGALGEQLLAERCPDLPPTVEFTTPGGGRRLEFFLPKGVRLPKRAYGQQGRVHEELAVLGEGTITVLPPSVHANGGLYAYVPGHAPWEIAFAPVPESVIRLASGGSAITADAAPAFDLVAGEATLAALAAKCPAFKRDWDVQRDEGVSEDRWFCWCALLVGAGYPDAAWAFSTASTKHDAHATARIHRLVDEAESRTGGLVRCTRLGCGEGQIHQCFGQVDRRTSGAVVNTPGRFFAPARPRLLLPHELQERHIVGMPELFGGDTTSGTE